MYKNVWEKNQSKGHNSETKKVLQSFLCATCHPDLIQIPIQLHEDISNDYLVMECIRIFEKKNQSKGHNPETKKGVAIILMRYMSS